MKLETKIKAMMKEAGFTEQDTFDVRAFELWRESEGGWSVNDGWRMCSGVSFGELLEAVRGRWEVFKANYFPKARVKDLRDDGGMDDPMILEVDFTAFLEISKVEGGKEP